APLPQARSAAPLALRHEFSRARVLGVEETSSDHATAPLWQRAPAITPLVEPLGVMQKTRQSPPEYWHCENDGWLPAVIGIAYTPLSPHRRFPIASNFWAMTLSATVETVVPSSEARKYSPLPALYASAAPSRIRP